MAGVNGNSSITTKADGIMNAGSHACRCVRRAGMSWRVCLARKGLFAYAAQFGLTAFVTRLVGLADLEAFVTAGLPLVASATFRDAELTGAGYSTAGHLFVVRGFTAGGDVIVNDPASHQVASNDEVRTVYRRREFERVWVRGSGGLVYVMHPPGHPLPDRPADAPPRW